MRTTLDLPDELFLEAKTLAVQKRTTLKNLITQFIRSGLSTQTLPSFESERRMPPPVAIRRISGQPPTRAFTNRQLHAILEEEDLQAICRPESQSHAKTSL
jgi:hypothetical protein